MSAPMTLSAYLDGIGLLGPGLTHWPSAQPILAGSAPYAPTPTVLPAPAMLPPAERRRTGKSVKLVLAIGHAALAAAGRDPAAMATVFAASGGDGDNCHALCEVLASDDRTVSPTRFHNSVHNAPAGYWGIATGAMATSDVVCAYDASFAAGLLEALTHVAVDGEASTLIAYDAPYPEPLQSARPIADSFGVALVLAPRPGPATMARLSVSLTDEPPSPTAFSGLEALRTSVPAARSLPLLELLARLGAPQGAGRVVIDYLAPTHLAVTVEPLDGSTSC
ncbi:hypothetical protein OTERR_20500 [Oryzomicrobium terrae]|uniref:Beta-ketoacyl synthase-like N-terminal domain-containing protein n=2 Tax=Oryzomicrobium terrae TaxID=1735038 RepID=A0A5C1E975_9RHOO|nr:hypothetical protein OTERR_20500 [Oryzomicrobium terrae]